MKARITTIAIFFILTTLAGIFIKTIAYYQEVISNQQSTIDSLTNIVSAQSEHFEKCSFLRKDDVQVGYDGYLYSKYHKSNKSLSRSVK